MQETEKPIRLLILTSYLLCPPMSGGAMRMINPIVKLCQTSDYQVTYLFQYTDEDQVKRAKSFFSDYSSIKVRGIRNQGPVCHKEDIELQMPLDVLNSIDLDYYRELERLLKTEQFDIVQVEHSWMSWVIPLVRKITVGRMPIVLDIHNVEYMLYERWMQYCTGSEYERIKNRYTRMRTWEQEVWNWYDAGLSVSSVEKQVFSESTGNFLPVWDLPTGGGVDMARFSGKEWLSVEGRNIMLYLGTMEWYPNVQGILWFIDEAMPLIKKRHPDVSLYIAGFGKPFDELLSHIAEREDIKYLGQQDDERDLLKKSKVYIVPLWIAAGARVKILTAWAAGIPIVSTTIGAEGLEYTPGENIIVTDDPASFADGVCNIIENHDLAISLSTAGRALVEKRYSLDIAAENYDKAYNVLISKSRSGALRRDATCFVEKERTIRQLVELKADMPVIMNYQSITRAMETEKATGDEPAQNQVNMQNSFTWRIFRSINRTTNRLFPRGTRRQHYLEIFLMGITVIHDEGWSNFFKKVKKHAQK